MPDLYHWILLAVLGFLFFGTLLNVLVFPRVRPGDLQEIDAEDSGDVGEKVSVLVPARNEEAVIGACAASLAVQDYPNLEVIVLDDRSEDRTREILQQHGFVDAGLNPNAPRRWIGGSELPEGWAGKPWACHQLSLAASGDWLLFTDADTEHDPRCVRAAVALARRERADLLSAWPRQITESWSEKLVVPLLYILTHVFLPQAMVRMFLRFPALARILGPARVEAFGAANGQFVMFRRDAYKACGGHAAVRDHLVEDVALGRRVMARTGEGARLINADGGAVVRCRMYRNFREVWEGFSKNIRPVFEGKALAFAGFGVLQAVLFIAPFVFLVVPAWSVPLVWAQCAVILAIRSVLALRFHTAWLGVVLHPFAYLLAFAIALNSWLWSRRGKVRWKGRVYDPFKRAS